MVIVIFSVRTHYNKGVLRSQPRLSRRFQKVVIRGDDDHGFIHPGHGVL